MAGAPGQVATMLRENLFWSGIFRDHAAFIHDNLAPGQEQLIRWAHNFQQTFERLNAEARAAGEQARVHGEAGSYALTGRPAEAPLAALQGQELLHWEREAVQVSKTMMEALASLKQYKQTLLQGVLECKVKLALGPGLVNHMIIELEEAQRALSGVRESHPLPPALEAIHHHLIWLPDAAGHAVAIQNRLDGVEQDLRMAAADFKHVFDGLHLRTLELYTMLRVAPRMIGAMKRLNRDAMTKIKTFRAFLGELREHTEGCELLGALMPLLADHMLREELYYTEKVQSLPDA